MAIRGFNPRRQDDTEDPPIGAAGPALLSGLGSSLPPPNPRVAEGLKSDVRGIVKDLGGLPGGTAGPAAPMKSPGLGAGAGDPGGIGGTSANDIAAGGAPTPKLDTSKFNTKGYAVPQYAAGIGTGVPAGYDAAKWNDPNYQSPKYAVGRILNEAGAPSIESIQKALPNLQQAYGPENVKFNGKDKISIDGGKSWVDVLTNAGSGQNMGWAWQDEASQAGGAPAGAVGPSGIPGNPLDALMGNGDVLARILAELGKTARPDIQ